MAGGSVMRGYARGKEGKAWNGACTEILERGNAGLVPRGAICVFEVAGPADLCGLIVRPF